MLKRGSPFIAANSVMPEFTPLAIILGIVLSIVFGGANAYLGLRVGQTVSASIPAAVISMALIRGVFRRESILENNIVQTIASAGESIAAGAIFTIPAFFLWSREMPDYTPGYLMITSLTLAGGILGVIFMIPLRRALIARESTELLFPEGRACADVLRAGEQGGAKAKITFIGLGVGALFKFLVEGFRIFPSRLDVPIKKLGGTAFGFDAMPALLGVGYILGPRVCSFVFSGGVIGWFCIMPLLNFFGSQSGVPIFPATVPITEMDHNAIWSNYLRYIGAGAVAFGGFFALISSFPVIVKSFADCISEIRSVSKEAQVLRTDKDLSFTFIVACVVAVTLFLIFMPDIPVGVLGALLILIFGFFFATVSARIVGVVGSSNSPVSGMTIATLLFTTLIFMASGRTGFSGQIEIMSIAAIICVVAAISGDTSQDLKTGYLLGATPKYQQIGELIGVTASALVIAGILMLLDKAWGFGSQQLPAVQATLMKLITTGVMNGDLPWVLVISGAGIGAALAILRLPVLAIAIGLYLPIYLSTPIMIGGCVKVIATWCLKQKKLGEAETKDSLENGMLYSSGLIAGEGLIGILLAGLTVGGVNFAIRKDGSVFGQWSEVLVFALLALSVLKFAVWQNKKKANDLK
jgi:putative OPT family oligopeptide transporter